MGENAKTKVLLVDDERVLAITLATILSSNGFNTATALTGEDAVDLAPKFQPDFLLSDVRLPGMNGIDVAIQVVTEQPECKVLLMSGHASTQDLLQQARSQGFNFPIVAKPIHPKALLEKIAEILSAPQHVRLT